jgi:metallo-beta-lactamase class B
MKKISCILLLAITLFSNLCFAYPVGNPFPPFQIAGNLYYVGADDLASYLVVTERGNILINSNLEANVPMIKKSIEELGFKFSDTKILLISHAHFDHAAGSQLIKQETKAKYMVMAEDVPHIESGGKSDFHYINDPSIYFPATKVDRVLHDGDQVQLGKTVLTAHLTAGHTKGCTTWTMQVMDHGKPYQVVILGSLGVNPGYKLINNTRYPKIAQDYEHAIEKSKSLRSDIFLGAHAGFFDLKKKYALMNHQPLNPFIDPQGYKKHIERKEREFYAELQKQKSAALVKDKSRVLAAVKKAENYIQKHGIEKSIMKFRKNSNNIFVGDYNGMFYVSPLHPDQVGENQFNFKDPSGVLVVQEEIAKAKAGGGWLKGRWRENPQTKTYQCRKIYILPIAGKYFIGSWYHYSSDKQAVCVI